MIASAGRLVKLGFFLALGCVGAVVQACTKTTEPGGGPNDASSGKVSADDAASPDVDHPDAGGADAADADRADADADLADAARADAADGSRADAADGKAGSRRSVKPRSSSVPKYDIVYE